MVIITATLPILSMDGSYRKRVAFACKKYIVWISPCVLTQHNEDVTGAAINYLSVEVPDQLDRVSGAGRVSWHNKVRSVARVTLIERARRDAIEAGAAR